MKFAAPVAVMLTALHISTAAAVTYYVRTDGGSAAQCTGRTDAALAGSAAHNCAWSHPFFALTASGRWKLHGGDSLVIRAGSYRMGYRAPNTGWCDATGSWGCHLPPLPSGPDPSHPTRILGQGWDAGCKNAPELWGTERANVLLSLDQTSNAQIECLELTDHSGCVEFHATEAARCERDRIPYGDWAVLGIFAADSSRVTLRNLNIHGFAGGGINAGRLNNWTVRKVRIAGNGWVGWDGDLVDGEDSNSGIIRFSRVKVEWNGCAETYPGKKFEHCWAQQSGGYGDGLGTGATGGHWIIEDSVFRYNTSDGLDLLYLGRPPHQNSLAEIRRTIAVGNAGNQMKISGNSTVVNSLLVGNCGFFHNKSFAQEMGDRLSGDHCRAYGGTLVVSLHQGNSAFVVNSTIAGEGDTLVGVECDSEFSRCDGSEKVIIQNNVFRGYSDFLQPGDRAAFVYDPDHYSRGLVAYNITYGAKDPLCSSHNLCANPLLFDDNLASFDGHLRPGSRAIDTGLPVGGLDGLVPADDLERKPRPQGRGVDRGAYEVKPD